MEEEGVQKGLVVSQASRCTVDWHISDARQGVGFRTGVLRYVCCLDNGCRVVCMR